MSDPKNNDTTQPQISVAIPCYNYARYVGQAIESAIEQDYDAKEVIVVNDGSTDGSLDIIRRYGDRIRIEDQPNQGSIPAYNKCFSLSRGDLVIFLDADDMLLPGALARIARAWADCPRCVKVQYDLSIIDADGQDLGRRFCNFPAGYGPSAVRTSFAETGTYRWPVTAGNAYARAFLQQLLPLDIDHGPDGHLNTAAPVFGEVATIRSPLGCYRLHDSNMWATTSSDESLLPERIRHRYQEIDFMRKHARKRGVEPFPGNPLDYELAFLTYRLMARQVGLTYPRSEEDSTWGLMAKAARVLRRENYAPPHALMHMGWFATLACCPPALAKLLISLRANRAQLKKAAREAIFRGRAEAA